MEKNKTISKNGVSYLVVGTLGSSGTATPRIVKPPSGVQCRVGSQIKYLLSTKWRIKAVAKCGCDSKAKEIDRWSCSECRQRIDEIVKMLKEGASERWWLKQVVKILPGVTEIAARSLVKDAIAAEEERTRSAIKQE